MKRQGAIDAQLGSAGIALGAFALVLSIEQLGDRADDEGLGAQRGEPRRLVARDLALEERDQVEQEADQAEDRLRAVERLQAEAAGAEVLLELLEAVLAVRPAVVEATGRNGIEAERRHDAMEGVADRDDLHDGAELTVGTKPLDPGTYWLSVIAINNSFSTDMGILVSSFSGIPGDEDARQVGSGLWGGGGNRALGADAAFRLSGTVIPEPSTGLLVAAGLALLSRRRAA